MRDYLLRQTVNRHGALGGEAVGGFFSFFFQFGLFCRVHRMFLPYNPVSRAIRSKLFCFSLVFRIYHAVTPFLQQIHVACRAFSLACFVP